MHVSRSKHFSVFSNSDVKPYTLQNRIGKGLAFLLFPVSLIYGLIVKIRHKLFDWNILSSTTFPLPVICVGNITVGGTGKTPHVEYLIELLQEKYKTAVLSRGYKRKTKGFILAEKQTNPELIGDEPYQMYRKFKSISVAVCEKRVLGINRLLSVVNKIRVILLDDAFQHRYVKADLNIVLIDYNRPVFQDTFLPSGSLRDSVNQLKRADILIVTKTPSDITDLDRRLWIKQLKLYPYQHLFFSTVVYDDPQPLYPKKSKPFKLSQLQKDKGKIHLVSGIANPTPLIDFIWNKKITFSKSIFPDHHDFTEDDLLSIKSTFDTIPGRKKVILTTEKDAVRLKHKKNYPRNLKDKTYYLPIRINFLFDEGKKFDKLLLKHVK